MSSFKSSQENEKTIRRANVDFVNNFFILLIIYC